MSADVEIATFDRGRGERLAVLWRVYEGFHFVDVRVQRLGTDGAWRSAGSGVTVKARELFGFADAITKACDRLKSVKR